MSSPGIASPSATRKRRVREDEDEEGGSVEDARADGARVTRRRIDEEGEEEGKGTRALDAWSCHSDPTERQQRSKDSEVAGAGADAAPEEEPTSTFIPYPDLTTPNTTPAPKPTPFQQPTQLTSFSYTPAHEQEFTDAALRYFVEPPRGARLGYGYERWVRRPDERGRLDALLRAFCRVRGEAGARAGGKGPLPQIAVVAWRGIMTKILTAPYENRDGWDLNVMLVNGTLYLEEHLTEARLNEKNNMDARQRSQTYYGYAFESYCTSETPPGQAPAHNTVPGAPVGWGGDVDTNVQWCSVVRTKLGDMRMIIGGEVDCVRGKYTGQTDTFVELKTSLTIRGRQDEERFERKLLKFYFQSFLLGVPEIVVGFRTPAGVVTTVQSFKTMQLPRMVRGKPGAWDPMVCMDWAAGLLQGLMQLIGASDRVRSTVWRARFVPGKGVSVAALGGRDMEEVVNGEERVGFLPRWYWEEETLAQGKDHRTG